MFIPPMSKGFRVIPRVFRKPMEVIPVIAVDELLLETGDFIFLETGDKIILE